MYKGTTTHSHTPAPQEVLRELATQPVPDMFSWRAIENPASTFVWEVKPPGKWVTLMRYDELLVTSDPNIPLDVDYELVFNMLKVHGASLLARLSNIGLIGIAVRKPHEPFTPCVPGYSVGSLFTTELVEKLHEKDYVWPEGLLEPSLIGAQEAAPLLIPDNRAQWLHTCPEGLWLLTVKGKLTIYEVL